MSQVGTVREVALHDGHCAYVFIVVDVPVFLRNSCSGFVGQEVKVVMRNEWGFMDIILLYVCLQARCFKGFRRTFNR
jgi:hypothetical protein